MRIIILSIILLILCSHLYSDESEDKLLKRTVVIMPYVNINKNTDFDFISFLLRDSLKSRLLELNLFNLVNFSDIDSTIKKSRLSINDLEDQNKSVKIGQNLKSDVVIIGKYSIIDDQIEIITNVVDIANNKSVIISIIKGQVGIKIFDLVEETSVDIAERMSKEFPLNYQKTVEVINQKLNSQNIAGIALISSGSTLILAGGGLLIYDFLGYMPIYLRYRNNASSGTLYEDYVKSYNTFMGLTFSGIGIVSLGLVLDIAGIPLIIYKEKNKKITLIIEPNSNFSIGLSYKF